MCRRNRVPLETEDFFLQIVRDRDECLKFEIFRPVPCQVQIVSIDKKQRKI